MKHLFHNLFLWNNNRSALSLHFLNSCIQVISFVFVNALFLTSYPTHWLIYFFIGQAAIDMIVSYLLAPMLIRNPRRYSTNLLIAIAIAIILICVFNTIYSSYYYPLVFSFFLMSVGFLTNIICWNNVRAAFDVIEFKELSTKLVIIHSVGDIIASISMVLFLKQWSINFLPYSLIVLILLTSFCTYTLTPLLLLDNTSEETTKPLHYPLYRKVFTTVFTVALIYTLIDYCLKYQLSIAIPTINVGEFIAIFSMIASIVALFINIFGVKYVIFRYGVSSLLSALPFYWFFTSIIVILYPSLLTVAFMAAGKYMFYYHSFTAGRELVLNVLPDAIRVSGQFLIKSIASPLANGMASLFLFIFAPYLPLTTFIIVIIGLNLFLILYIHKIRPYYLAVLKKAIHLKRFDLILENSNEIISKFIVDHDTKISRYAILASVERHNPELIRTIIERTLQGGVFHADKQSLIQNKDTIPELVKVITETKESHHARLRLLINILASIPHPEAEDQLMLCIEDKNTLFRQWIIEELAHRTIKLSLHKKNLPMIEKAIQNELLLIRAFELLLFQYKQYVLITREINVKIVFSKKRLLYLIAIQTGLYDIVNLIPMILEGSKIKRAKAIELFASILQDHALLYIFMQILLNKQITMPDHTFVQPETIIDGWLKKVIHTVTSNEVNNIMDR